MRLRWIVTLGCVLFAAVLLSADSLISALTDGGRGLFDDELISERASTSRKHDLEDVIGYLGYGHHLRRSWFFDDLVGETTTTVGRIFETNSGTGAATALQALAATNRPGMLRSTTGTTATGRAAVATGLTAYAIGAGAVIAELAVNVTTLSTGTERYQLVVGLFDTATAANQVDCICFVYDEGGVSTGSTAAAYWQTATVSNSTRTWNTSLTQTTVTAGGWDTLRIDVNAGGTSAEFRIDGALVATHTANIPTGSARVLGVGWLMIKSIGTTARTLDVDYVLAELDFTTNR